MAPSPRIRIRVASKSLRPQPVNGFEYCCDPTRQANSSQSVASSGATAGLSSSALVSPQLAARSADSLCQSPILGHQKPEKIFVEIGPALVLTCILKCPLGVFAVEDVQPPPRTRVAHEHQYG